MSSCRACAMAVESAQKLMDAGVLPDEYDGDPEGASMYAYDQGWLCGGHICLSEEADEGDEYELGDRISGSPDWVIALWKEEKERDVFLPLAMAWDYWPVGGTYTQIADQLGLRGEPEEIFLVGGIYVGTKRPIVGLVCLDTKLGDALDEFVNPVMLTCDDVNLEEWGLS